MSWNRIVFGMTGIASLCLLVSCATNTMQTEGMVPVTSGDLPYGSVKEPHYMRHTLREVVEYDVTKMSRLINRELDMKETSDDAFMSQAASVLGQTVMLHTHFTERESAIRDFKGKLDQEDYLVALDKAADQLITIYRTSPYTSDQVGALTALTNVVVEIKGLKRAELKPTLQKIANANLEVSPSALKYAQESMEHLISPSSEAQSALQTL